MTVGFISRGSANEDSISAIDPEGFNGDIPLISTGEYWQTSEGAYPSLETVPHHSGQTTYKLDGLMRGSCFSDETETERVPELATTSEPTLAGRVSDGVVETAAELSYIANRRGEFTDIVLTVADVLYLLMIETGTRSPLSPDVTRPLFVTQSNSRFPELQSGPDEPSYCIVDELKRVADGPLYVECGGN